MRFLLDVLHLAEGVSVRQLYRQYIAYGIYARDGGLQVVGELCHKLPLLHLELHLTLTRTFQFLTHYIKALGECAEDIVLLHHQR